MFVHLQRPATVRPQRAFKSWQCHVLQVASKMSFEYLFDLPLYVSWLITSNRKRMESIWVIGQNLGSSLLTPTGAGSWFMHLPWSPEPSKWPTRSSSMVKTAKFTVMALGPWQSWPQIENRWRKKSMVSFVPGKIFKKPQHFWRRLFLIELYFMQNLRCFRDKSTPSSWLPWFLCCGKPSQWPNLNQLRSSKVRVWICETTGISTRLAEKEPMTLYVPRWPIYIYIPVWAILTVSHGTCQRSWTLSRNTLKYITIRMDLIRCPKNPPVKHHPVEISMSWEIVSPIFRHTHLILSWLDTLYAHIVISHEISPLYPWCLS